MSTTTATPHPRYWGYWARRSIGRDDVGPWHILRLDGGAFLGPRTHATVCGVRLRGSLESGLTSLPRGDKSDACRKCLAAEAALGLERSAP